MPDLGHDSLHTAFTSDDNSKHGSGWAEMAVSNANGAKSAYCAYLGDWRRPQLEFFITITALFTENR
ncbi:hypothetical protein NQZ68_027369 [Dissostichus eleginoides]|nr:hypothetical protein NQZ68_027369 [Dissostichus eleginoides]